MKKACDDMDRPITTLFMLMSVDGKITTGSSDHLDFDQALPHIRGCLGGRNMFKRIVKCILLWLLVQLASSAICSAEGLDNCTYIDAEKYIRPSYLTCSGMLSDDRYWYSGTTKEQEPWILISDSMGNVIDQRIVPVDRKRHIIKGLNMSNQGVLIGLIDSATQKGMIMHRDSEGRTNYTDLGNTNVYEYTPTGDGGLIAQCVWYNSDATLCAPQIVKINGDGLIQYDIIDKPVKVNTDRGALTRSIICENNGSVYALQVHGIPEKSGTKEILICFDYYGQETWRTAIPDSEDIEIQEVMVDGENIYLVGYIGEWMSEYVIGNRKGIVICYSQDGKQKWMYSASDAEEFQHGSAENGLCVVGQMIDDKWRLWVISDQGKDIFRADIEAENCYMQKICITKDQKMIILGITNDKLLLKEMVYE